MGGCPEEGPQLRTKELGLVEANPNGPPAKERVLFPGHVEKRGELVSAHIEGSDHHRRIRESLGYMTVSLVLLLF
jgi:hypothetical protein